ncbi:AVR9/CF-9 RAPIDLY ELICITED PROTEIN-RELATED [Salix viminalis]|uniref:AVR9/CF-9 RAPIDLY ELICITED PROTEIN-RELATED n=1 Tax=Salix viminalis TaxID=40686 RepID=A0A9Q0SE48_SALVM|nr:AVR9/CF-9 RAPIDLY ELICITED PROTEIN-RELATED [Salix viminalis]
MSQSPPWTAKKVCHMVRLIFLMIQKGMLKSKVMLDLHFLMKRGKILGKALNEIIVQQHDTLSCISQDVHMSFISPREYEFSCSGSPAYKFYSHKHPYYRAKRRNLLDHYKHARFHAPSQDGDHDLVSSACGGDVVVEASPLVGSARWFGTWSPLVRQVRITDSPFTMRDADEDCHVDKEAEQFIEMFYKQLRLQKWMAAHEAAV